MLCCHHWDNFIWSVIAPLQLKRFIFIPWSKCDSFSLYIKFNWAVIVILQDQMLPSANLCIKETRKFPKQVQHKRPFTVANNIEEMKQGEESTYLLDFFFLL